MMVLEAFSLLSIPAARHVASNALAFAVRAPTPVAPGHTLIAPRRLVARWVDARPDERAALWQLVDVVRADLQRLGLLEGFQVSLDDGPAAGRPIPHLHLHVIPRRDRAAHFAAEGGLTHAPYLARPAPLATGGADDPFLRHLAHPMSRAKTIDILAAFVRASGVTALADRLGAALDRGARVRVLTGGYLHITQAEALYARLDLVRSSACDEDALQVRVIEIERLATARTFHPKAWLLTGANFTTAFVGSSNLSRAALYDGVEWNLRVDERRDAFAVAAIRSAYEALWRRARPVDEAWLQVYADNAREADLPLPPGEADAPEDSPPVPRDVQVQALDALTEARAVGRMRALVVMATGLGKTWLAAFDVDRWREETGRSPRVLLVAHRRELLKHEKARARTELGVGRPRRIWIELQGG